MIDLRSDTVTRPTAAMREAMARADVGDDIYGEDPTVRRLEERTAELAGKEAALFVSSGTMGNQLAIACHTRPGDEVIVPEGAHPVWYESGAGAALSGVQFAQAGAGGLFRPDDVDAAIKPLAFYAPRTSLVCVENTHNRSGGRVFPQADVEAIAERARARHLRVHLDGARLWNASIATGLSIEVLCAPFDTASLCFSKGLGAPVGSALVGTRALIEEARRFRKMWGGAMRQVGILAAAALYALDHHRERLRDDHENAKRLASLLEGARGIHVDASRVETNIVNIDVEPKLDVDALANALRARSVAINPSGPSRLRAVTHLDVSRAEIDAAAHEIARAVDAALTRAEAR
jgi:threonine aldolase